jgi:hypothetical protein
MWCNFFIGPDLILILILFCKIEREYEVKGGALRSKAQLEVFRDTLDDWQLCDLGFQGSKYTWSNKWDAGEFTKERLDRATANSDWCNIFNDVLVEVLAARTSDHSPLLVHFGRKIFGRQRKKKIFGFEASWCIDESCRDVV